MDSILTSIKLQLGISEEDDSFDTQLIIHINSVLSDLYQLGIGKEGFVIEDEYSTWTDFIPYDILCKLIGIETYVYMRVKLIFDPPVNSAVLTSMQQQIDRFEWRLNVTAESLNSES